MLQQPWEQQVIAEEHINNEYNTVIAENPENIHTSDLICTIVDLFNDCC